MHAVEPSPYGNKLPTAFVVTVQRPDQSDHDVEASFNEMKRLARTAGIDVLDHVVVGEGRYVSFAEAGLMQTSG